MFSIFHNNLFATLWDILRLKFSFRGEHEQMMRTGALPLGSINIHREFNVTINFQDTLSWTRVLVKVKICVQAIEDQFYYAILQSTEIYSFNENTFTRLCPVRPCLYQQRWYSTIILVCVLPVYVPLPSNPGK